MKHRALQLVVAYNLYGVETEECEWEKGRGYDLQNGSRGAQAPHARKPVYRTIWRTPRSSWTFSQKKTTTRVMPTDKWGFIVGSTTGIRKIKKRHR